MENLTLNMYMASVQGREALRRLAYSFEWIFVLNKGSIIVFPLVILYIGNRNTLFHVLLLFLGVSLLTFYVAFLPNDHLY